MKSFRVHVLAVLAALGALTLALPSFADEGPSAGIWQEHKYTLHFMGFTTTYSCDGLEEKVRDLLLWAGARGDAKSSAYGCARGYGEPSKFASAEVTFYSLTGAAAGDATAVPATWRKVKLAAHHPLQLGEGDCELVEQFRDQLLPMFTTRAVNNHTSCAPHAISPGDLNLEFEVLVPVTAAPAKSP
jgi:hypothetical protein